MRSSTLFDPLRVIAACLVLVASLATATAARADPPVRVARLSYLEGMVSFAPAGTDGWVAAGINRPLYNGDQLWADRDGRAELDLGNITLWLDRETSMSVSNIDDRIAQFELGQGAAELRVRSIASGNAVEIDTPNLAFSITRPGRYRVEVDPQGQSTIVMVRDGVADVYGDGAAYKVSRGQGYRFYGTDLRESESFALPASDELDRFVARRDARYARPAAVRYVSPEVIGYTDLDEYGTWTNVPDYGNVWYPRNVASDWAPYRDGHWAWIEPWGWTWVDDAPWGFAPFHYGRWAFVRQRWCWIPGPRTVRPVYAPALVAFIGGAGFSVALSSGPAIGWIPLGPRDIYRPSYRVSRDYFTRVNVSNTVVNNVQIVNVYNNYTRNVAVPFTQASYANLRAPNAVTAVPPAAFANAQPVRRVAVQVPAATLQRAQFQPSAPVVPAAAAVAGAAPAARVRPPAAVEQRTVIARTQPPPPPAPLAQRLPALERNPGFPAATPPAGGANAPVTRPGVAPPAAAPATPAGGPGNRPGVRVVNAVRPATTPPPAKPLQTKPGEPPGHAVGAGQPAPAGSPGVRRPQAPAPTVPAAPGSVAPPGPQGRTPASEVGPRGERPSGAARPAEPAAPGASTPSAAPVAPERAPREGRGNGRSPSTPAAAPSAPPSAPSRIGRPAPGAAPQPAPPASTPTPPAASRSEPVNRGAAAPVAEPAAPKSPPAEPAQGPRAGRGRGNGASAPAVAPPPAAVQPRPAPAAPAPPRAEPRIAPQPPSPPAVSRPEPRAVPQPPPTPRAEPHAVPQAPPPTPRAEPRAAPQPPARAPAPPAAATQPQHQPPPPAPRQAPPPPPAEQRQGPPPGAQHAPASAPGQGDRRPGREDKDKEKG